MRSYEVKMSSKIMRIGAGARDLKAISTPDQKYIVSQQKMRLQG